MDRRFHKGELYVQRRAGEEAAAERNGTMVANRIMAGARPFLHQQPMIVVASVDATGAVWASMVFGKPGFLSSEDGSVLEVNLAQAMVDRHDPVWANVGGGRQLGSLVIDLLTRRRIRVNGRSYLEQTRGLLQISVEESYPNCPKYITRRELELVWDSTRGDDDRRTYASGSELSETMVAAIESSSTMFVATRSAPDGFDASHRGGPAGFMRVKDRNTIRWPDYVGNSMFNTLGNLEREPHAGLVIPDFERGRALQLTGRAVTAWDQSDAANESGGTHRFVELTVARWRELPLPAGLRSAFIDYSSFNPQVCAR